MYFRFGFESALGSLGASALVGLVALIGIVLVIQSRKDGKIHNKIMFGIGIALIILASLPYLPLLGISVLSDSLTSD